MNKMLPFSFLPLACDVKNKKRAKSKFIDNVEKVLEQDIQSPNQFGCKIRNCHTHAGSKVHFKDFVEAELLFHNSYYNQGFAFLTVQEIVKVIQLPKVPKQIVLIGYETYSELYLQEVRQQLDTFLKDHSIQSRVSYCVYESFAKNENGVRKTSTKIRNLFFNQNSDSNFTVRYGYQSFDFEEEQEDTLCVFIVPINTTLTTMDKMMSKFKNQVVEQYREMGNPSSSEEAIKTRLKEIFDSSLKLCLITIESDTENNDYWHRKSDCADTQPYDRLIPKKNKFTELRAECDEIMSFAMITSRWQIVNGSSSQKDSGFCECCFPDQHKGSLLDEEPIFDVTRGSVVPMLQLGKATPGEPAKTYDGAALKNLQRVSVLMTHTAHRHLSKGDDHFQFYFDSMGFLSDERVLGGSDSVYSSVSNFLTQQAERRKRPNTVVYNYIIAPRHNTNAKWVSIVNSAFLDPDSSKEKRLQYGVVRTLYFDITKEYRSNLQAKYSDFYREIQNVIGSELYCRNQSGQSSPEIEIRFHYVDITIASGRSILRAADLVRSLLPMEQIRTMSDRIRISLFDSIFLLYCRSSRDSQKFYGNLFQEIGAETDRGEIADRFYSYVKINISHMRSHEDACTLCRLKNDYLRIQEECATNRLAKICNRVIQNHEITPISDLPQITYSNQDNQETIVFPAEEEKQYLIFITHLINERFSSNRPVFQNEATGNLPVECESESSVVPMVTVLKDYYTHLSVGENLLIEYSANTKKNSSLASIKLKTAFIKSISRPFFVYHLRKRQAAFSFCLDQLADILESSKGNDLHQLILTNTLVKALCDMNANFIFRSTAQEKGTLDPFKELMRMAENGDRILSETDFNSFNPDDDYIRSNLFSTEHYLHYIKKMLSLSQDKTKSVLLENILLKGCEDDFFGRPSSENLMLTAFLSADTEDDGGQEAIQKLNIRGMLYLENNKVLIDALNSENVPDHLPPYYLDNCYSILTLNQQETIRFPELYRCFQRILRIADTTDTKNQLNTLSNLICSELKNEIAPNIGEIILFVRNKAVSDNSRWVNKFFEFFCFGTDKELGADKNQRFYCDTNFSQLRELVGYMDRNGCDVCVKENRALIRFCTKPNGADSQDDESIYLICNEFESTINSWFYLKFVMLLRNEIVRLMNGANMSTTISGLSKAMQEAALSINKAITHSSRETYMNLEFCSFDDIKVQDYPLGHCSSYAQESIVKCVIEKYLQVISNEWLSSIYRKLVRESELYDYFYAQFLNQESACNASTVKEDLLLFFGFDLDDSCNDFEVQMHFEEPARFYNIKIAFSGVSYFDDFQMVASLPRIGTVNPLINILSLLAGNVASHSGELDSECRMEVEFCAEGDLIIRNSCRSRHIPASAYLDPYPWCHEKPHLTLWTLSHCVKIVNKALFELAKNQQDHKVSALLPNDAFSMNVNPPSPSHESDEGTFTVVFKHYLFGKKEIVSNDYHLYL